MKQQREKFKVLPGKGLDHRRRLRKFLQHLSKTRHACAMKLSTEDAGMGWDQIEYWTQSCQGVLPVLVKIGGPNARSDIKKFLEMKVDGLIAPMVESVYGLENFIHAVRDFTTPLQFAGLKKQINIETITAARSLDAILDSPPARDLNEVTIGCKDLSLSMETPVEDHKVLKLVKKLVRKIKAQNLPVSVGGGITPMNINHLIKKVKPDQFNTRVITFDVLPGVDYSPAVTDALEFELLMLDSDMEMGFISKEEQKFRSRELKARLK